MDTESQWIFDRMRLYKLWQALYSFITSTVKNSSNIVPCCCMRLCYASRNRLQTLESNRWIPKVNESMIA